VKAPNFEQLAIDMREGQELARVLRANADKLVGLGLDSSAAHIALMARLYLTPGPLEFVVDGVAREFSREAVKHAAMLMSAAFVRELAPKTKPRKRRRKKKR